MKQGFVRKEIGSEFWDVPVGGSGAPLPADTRWFMSGTSALEYIICDIKKQRSLKRVGVPSWCCSCMIQPFADAGADVVFYPVYVDEVGRLSCDYSAVADCDATLVLTYFGYQSLQSKGVPGGIKIRDLTHSIFCGAEADAQYYFGSLRKWVGVWTGGYAWKQGAWAIAPCDSQADPAFLRCREVAMRRKLDYLEGRSEEKDYLALYDEAEEFLDRGGVMGSCSRDIRCAAELDVAHIRARRRENAQVLLSAVRDFALFPEFGAEDCPMFVPILLPDRAHRDGLRRHLIAREIYCPVHWPVSDLHVLGEKERVLYDRSLSLVCDQRYDTADMQRMVDAIEEYVKNNME